MPSSGFAAFAGSEVKCFGPLGIEVVLISRWSPSDPKAARNHFWSTPRLPNLPLGCGVNPAISRRCGASNMWQKWFAEHPRTPTPGPCSLCFVRRLHIGEQPAGTLHVERSGQVNSEPPIRHPHFWYTGTTYHDWRWVLHGATLPAYRTKRFWHELRTARKRAGEPTTAAGALRISTLTLVDELNKSMIVRLFCW